MENFFEVIATTYKEQNLKHLAYNASHINLNKIMFEVYYLLIFPKFIMFKFQVLFHLLLIL